MSAGVLVSCRLWSGRRAREVGAWPVGPWLGGRACWPLAGPRSPLDLGSPYLPTGWALGCYAVLVCLSRVCLSFPSLEPLRVPSSRMPVYPDRPACLRSWAALASPSLLSCLSSPWCFLVLLLPTDYPRSPSSAPCLLMGLCRPPFTEVRLTPVLSASDRCCPPVALPLACFTCTTLSSPLPLSHLFALALASPLPRLPRLCSPRPILAGAPPLPSPFVLLASSAAFPVVFWFAPSLVSPGRGC
jgi:hypothetical protein